MKTGKMRERCEILDRKVLPDSKGQAVKTFEVITKRRGFWIQAGGRDFLMANAEMNVREGTLQTHYFAGASEEQYIRMNGADVYEVVSFNHDSNKSTLWTLRIFKG